MLVTSDDLPLFDRTLSPFEEEAYEILKSRSRRTSPLRSPQAGHTPRRHLITPVPDLRGGFQLQALEDENRSALLQDLNHLRLSESFPDTSVDPSSSRSPTLLPNWLLAETTPPDSGPGQSDASVPWKEGAPGRNGHSVADDVLLTVVDAPRHKRALLSQVFGSMKKSHSSTVSPEKLSPGKLSPDEFELTTVHLSKTKQSLGISISGGSESRVQPMVKIEKIFPGGAASTSDALRAGFELVSVDGVSLEKVSHQAAVEIIRQSFSNKSRDPMELVVKVPRAS